MTMTKTDTFSIKSVQDRQTSAMRQVVNERDEAITQTSKIRMDRSAEIRQFFANDYCKSFVRELQIVSRELRGKLDSGCGETIGRYQAVSDILDKLEDAEKKARR